MPDMDLRIVPFCEERKGTKLLAEIMEEGSMTPEYTRRVFDIYEAAAKAQPDAILVECTTIGDVSRTAGALYELMDIPVIALDKPAADYVVSQGTKIGLIINLHTTIETSKQMLERCAAEQGKDIEIVLGYKKAFGLSQEQIRDSMIETVKELESQVDVFFLAQPSMSEWEAEVQAAVSVPVISVLPQAAKAVREVLTK